MAVMAKELIEFEHYVHNVLDLHVTTKPWPQVARLPFFLRDQYAFFETRILEAPCLLVMDQGEREPAPATVRKHLDQLLQYWNGEIVYVRNQVTTYNRKRLIEQKVPFVIPGNQMYLPMLGIDLREHYRKALAGTLTLKPSTQALLIHMLLRRAPGDRLTPLETALELGYTPMTMTRAFSELEGAGLVGIFKEGRERCLYVPRTRRELWDQAQPLMRSPVREKVLAKLPPNHRPGPFSGLTGLARYTDLAAPEHPIFAVTTGEWTALQKTTGIEKIPHREPGTSEVEIWSYPPQWFAQDDVVDRLSLFLSLKNDPDERIAASLDEMMAQVKW